jgi:hypothetical protein
MFGNGLDLAPVWKSQFKTILLKEPRTGSRILFPRRSV